MCFGRVCQCVDDVSMMCRNLHTIELKERHEGDLVRQHDDCGMGCQVRVLEVRVEVADMGKR